MEGLKKRALFTGVILIAAGLFIQMSPAVNLVKRTESFLEERAPDRIGDYVFYPNPTAEKPKQSYVVEPSTYDTLKPFGIVGRVYQKGSEGYDVLLIASNDKNSFHDQNVCFTAQGWTLANQSQEMIETSRGTIPITFSNLLHTRQGRTQITAYTYKGPDGFYATPRALTMAMLVEQLKGGTRLECIFYRFIPVREGVTKEELLSFVRSYLEEAGEFSKGYF